jgi:beta-glucosidase
LRSTRRLPDGFLIGSASAAHQVEGGLWNDWMRMEVTEPHRIHDGGSAAVAIDHFRRYRDDLALLAAMHHRAYRFSIEWARVEPQPGCFDAEALQHYADVVRTCRDLGMEPIVSLQHFTLPVWLADRGGVLHTASPRLFARYAAACAEALGAGVRWWVTINEPNVLATFAYANGQWPPHQDSAKLALAASAALLRMHAAAARAVRDVADRHGRSAYVSIAHHERRLRPVPGSIAARLAAPLPNFVFNRWFLRSCQSGRVLPPVGRGRRVAGLRGSLDYIGVNYYCEELVRFDPTAHGSLFVTTMPDLDRPRTSFGWPIDPDGLRRALLDLWRTFRLPLLVTENGVSDDHDELRAGYIVDHLRAVLDAGDAGADVRGYLYWTGFDNFEWLEGYSQRFGLVSVDRETMERRPKPSAAVYAEICRTLRLPA